MLLVRLNAKTLMLLFLLIFGGNKYISAQDSADLGGIVVDQNGAVIPGVEVTILNLSGTLERKVLTDDEGFFAFPFLPPDEYTLKISKEGFDPSEVENLLVAEGNSRQFKIELKINQLSEAIKVESVNVSVNEDKGNSTTFDQTTIENFPVNGRNHQSLINLVPGIIFTPVTSRNLGQFSTNGQRTNANYFSVDGVSANFGTTNYDFLGQTGSGSIPAMNIQGGLDNLVSTEALQEVTIQTLDFAPATGKMPGATVSFVSKSGGDHFSATLFENFRNDVFNAKDYFDLEKPPHNFNNFGGSFGGPLFFQKHGKNQSASNQTFFFLAYEGKQFTLPQPTVTMEVPSDEIRKFPPNQVAKAIYNSFPLSNEKAEKPFDKVSGQINAVEKKESASVFFPDTALFSATYSDPNNAENYNLRIDHIFNPNFSVFGRFNHSPSFSENRNPANLSAFTESEQLTRTFTFGSTQMFSAALVNEIRFNSSTQNGNTNHNFDGKYGGILPDKSIFIPNSFAEDKTHFRFSLTGFPDSLVFYYGNFAQNEMRQTNISDTFSYSGNGHELKFGVDYRELLPTLRAAGFGINYNFNSVESVSNGTANRVSYYTNSNVNTTVSSISSFFQDNWKIKSNLNLIYGLRWEINPSPSTLEKDALLTLENAPNLAQADQTKLKLAPAGTPYYKTAFDNFAPRIGVAFQLFNKEDKQFVLRGGAGTFYDLGQSQFNEIASPYERTNEFTKNLSLPINDFPSDIFSNSNTSANRPTVISASSDYELPRTYFWNLTGQIKFGNQMFSAAYVGGAGRELQRTLTLNLTKPDGLQNQYYSDDFSKIIYIDNAYSSDYHALQLQFAQNLSAGLTSFVNYTWAHSIDNNSSDSNLSTPFLNYPVSTDRGNSDFDVRHSFNAGFSYNLPQTSRKDMVGDFLKNWSFSGLFFARSGLPFDVKIAEINSRGDAYNYRRADLIEGVPVYLKTGESPTGFRINADAFAKPEKSFRQGNMRRNSLNGSSVWQFDTALAKKINLTDKLQLHLRIEVFNVFNQPNFSNPQTEILYVGGEKIITSNFGSPTQTMARGYASSEPTGGVSPVFQLGGPRTMQFSVRLKF
jgi:Carboxypeptidase regulatory-like domain/TonB dependent receptor